MQHFDFAPEPEDSWPLLRDGMAVVALALSALCVVVLALPSDGRISAPLHQALGVLLGQAAFMLPIGLSVAGVLLLVRSVRPEVHLPRLRLVGLGVLAVAVVAAEDRLAPNGGGLLGAWLNAQLQDLLGGPAAFLIIVGGLVAGFLMTFHVGARQIVRFWSARSAQAPPTRVLSIVPRADNEDGRAAS